ncbi:carboxypeptidase-like regulatory domain-containing protein [Rubinisphaera sp.]|uniref:carboxypeptidase-like regulatory domain-containing protein n=1 Tax=Rubinisphaera sp. TaxID=2024857 RepID=UPI000C0DD81C|nr:carboxypeptidase-like regulatory domain-containing protein [Rubinisphaera sp.]MBV09179.1 hypothetical protein [Rubinisphaera sp.]HCS50513.1 hypothetical protein [Planctomycetaceae bacterium]|tara:strand:+ start:78 stop:422 length:345 start_codon:yes stop_codon:yes gene_type:complete
MKRHFYILLITVSVITGCEGRTKIAGTVADGTGTLIENAQVKLKTNDPDFTEENQFVSECTTEADGEFDVAITHQPSSSLKLTFSVIKDGYKPHTEEIDAGYFDDNRKVTLEKK